MSEEAKKLAVEPYKGVRDFYPEDMFMQNYILDTMRSVAERFGFVEYSSSILEPAELYEAKSGEEIINEQTYTFEDRGKRRVTLRPEMTPSVARLVAARKRELAFPLRWYSIPNVFRYERPQKGRLREHFQLNCDIFGVPSLEADIEIITLASAIMREFGAKDGEFEIRINNRKALNENLDEAGLDLDEKNAVFKLLDKKDKIDDFEVRLKTLTDKPFDLPLSIDEESQKVIDALEERGVSNARFDTSTVRGFDYYTGIIFEVFDLAPGNNRSLFGGGRYDNLLDIFGVENVPAVGFGMGDVTMRDFLEDHGLKPEYIPPTDLFIATVSENNIPEAQKLAATLRTQGLTVAVNLLDKKVGDQIKVALKQAIPFVLTLGDEETKSKNYPVKHLDSGKEEKVEEDNVADFVWSQALSS